MEYRRFGAKLVVRLDPGEEIVSALTELCKNEKILLAEVRGLGAVGSLTVGLFDVSLKQFQQNQFCEPLEITSLWGTVTQSGGEPYLHLHISAADSSGWSVGGHLVDAVISATGELVIEIINGSVGRKHDTETGLNLFEF